MNKPYSQVIVLSFPHFVFLTLVAVYFQISFIRSLLFDCVLGGLSLLFGYYILHGLYRGDKIVVDMGNGNKEPNKIVYTQEYMRSIKKDVLCDDKWFIYNVEIMDVQSEENVLHPSVQQRIDDGEYYAPSAKSYAYASNFTEEEQRAYRQVMKEVGPEYIGKNLPILSKETQIGKIVRINRLYGLIQTVEPLLGLYCFCFHCEENPIEGTPRKLQTGDRVMFSLAIANKRVNAIHVQRIAQRTISSPDFSRLVAHDSRSHLDAIEPFELS